MVLLALHFGWVRYRKELKLAAALEAKALKVTTNEENETRKEGVPSEYK